VFRLAIDWDGTLAQKYAGGAPTRWRPGAKEALEALLAGGCEIVIHSARLTPPEPFNADGEAADFYARGALSEDLLTYWALSAELRAFLEAEGFRGRVEFWDGVGKPHADRFCDDLAELPDDLGRLVREFGAAA
jgi:phosphoserine phosphatase